MKTYNFLVIFGQLQKVIDIDAYSQEEALSIMKENYPRDEGYIYFLI